MNDVEMRLGQEKAVLYVNTEYGNEVTLEESMGDQIDSFGDVTWRELIEDYRGEDLSNHQGCLDGWLEDEGYGITAAQLDEKLGDDEIERYFETLAFHLDNYSGASAEAFALIRSLHLFPMDNDGNGSSHGVELCQSYAHGPRKYVWITDQAAADWLVDQAGLRGVLLEVVFV